MRWKDTTSYSRDERGKAEPRVWQLETKGLRLQVHRLHGYEGWYVSAHDVGIEGRALKATDAEDAKLAGVALVRAQLELALKRLNDAAPQSSEVPKP